MKKAVLAVLIAAFVTAVIYAVPINGETEIYNKVVRLHVIANSDSEEDQALKLAVRDAILEKVSSATENCSSREEAEDVISSMLPEIVKQAEITLRDNGSDYHVSALIGKENYPTREYGDIRLPAGNYSSLRVMIGKAEGKNWWCVLFPPLCTGTAKPDDTLVARRLHPRRGAYPHRLGKPGIYPEIQDPRNLRLAVLLTVRSFSAPPFQED